MKKQSRVKRVKLHFLSRSGDLNRILEYCRHMTKRPGDSHHVLSVSLLSLSSVRAGELVIIHHLWCVTRFDTETLEGARFCLRSHSGLIGQVIDRIFTHVCDTRLTHVLHQMIPSYPTFAFAKCFNTTISECVSLRLIIV